MKKFAVLITGGFLLMNTAFAGGILTNTNQSAQFVRMLSRNASTDLDAVYFNPAGLTQMENGFYFGLNNQSIWQTRTINSGFFQPQTDATAFLSNHNSTFKGETSVPFFPDAYAVYKLDNWAFSVGFGPNAGGGTAKYNTGLPSFEKQIASMSGGYQKLAPIFSGYQIPGVTDYGVDISFKGSSIFWGIQGGATYKVNKILSVYLGARYVPTTNTYNGGIKNIKVTVAGNSIPASQYQTMVTPVMNGLIGSLQSSYQKIEGAISTKLIDGNANIADPTLQGTLDLLGSKAKTYSEAVTSLKTTEAQLDQLNKSDLSDKAVDVKQTGGGVTPIIGFDIHLDKLNIGLKYEHTTIIGLTNKTVADGTGLFPNGQKTNSDIPAIISGGADYQITDKLKISGSGTYFLDKNVNWGKNVYLQDRTIDKNFVELSFGLEYKITDDFAVSAGYMNSNTGVSEQYQSDFSYSNDSYTFGGGFQWKLTEKLVLDAGVLSTTYKDATKAFTDPTFGKYNETYGKTTFDFAIGIGYKIF